MRRRDKWKKSGAQFLDWSIPPLPWDEIVNRYEGSSVERRLVSFKVDGVGRPQHEKKGNVTRSFLGVEKQMDQKQGNNVRTLVPK